MEGRRERVGGRAPIPCLVGGIKERRGEEEGDIIHPGPPKWIRPMMGGLDRRESDWRAKKKMPPILYYPPIF